LGHVYLTLEVFGNIPCGSSADFMKLSIIRNPTIFPLQDKNICNGDSIQLVGVASNWNFVLWSTSGDGNFSNAANLYPIYTPGINDIINGTVTLSLTAFGISPCSNSVSSSMILTINPIPTPVIAGPVEVCAIDHGVVYNTPNVQGHSYDWGVTGGIITSGQNTSQISINWGGPTMPGSVSVIETDTITGCLNSQVYGPIIINPLPDANAGPDQFIPGNTNTQLNGTVIGGSGNYTLSWSPDSLLVDATVEDPVTVILNATTDFTFMATDTVTGCNSFEDVVTIFNSGTLSLNPVAIPDTICIGDTSTLYPNAGGGSGTYIYSWISDPPGFYSNLETPAVSPSVTTIYELIVYDGYNTITGSTTVTVVPSASAGLDATICIGDSYTLNGSAFGYYSLVWSTSGDGSFNDTTILNPVYTPGPGDSTLGLVILTLNVTGAQPCGSVVASSMTLTIQHLPTADAGPDATICEGNDITLGGSATNYSSVLWMTSGDGTFDDATLLDATYTPGLNDIVNGTATLTLSATALQPCGSVTTSNITLTITPYPIVNLNNDTTLCKNDSIILDAGNPGCNFMWSTGAITQSITVTSSVDTTVTYYVIVTNPDGCLSTASITVTWVTCTSIEDRYGVPQISIFPNPTTGKFKIHPEFSGSKSKTDVEMRIMNIHGQEIFRDNFVINSSPYTKEFDLHMLPKGVYFINFSSENFVKTKKLVIR